MPGWRTAFRLANPSVKRATWSSDNVPRPPGNTPGDAGFGGDAEQASFYHAPLRFPRSGHEHRAALYDGSVGDMRYYRRIRLRDMLAADRRSARYDRRQ